ncbi:MAG: DsrE/DsrF/DrsH-like family protein [Desulfobacterales bacterium]|nr:DsrE/DsrF/DrsH-like family protein [Desulfobacterales bacterium]
MEASIKMMEKEKNPQPEPQGEAATFICSRDTIEGVYPALLLAINARRQGMEASIFYTFMGLNVIRKGWAKKVKFIPPGFMGAIPGMATMATAMMKKKIENAGIPDIEDMMDMAMAEGVQFVGCQMTVDMMELSQDDFIDGVELWTAEDYMKHAKNCKINMFT